MKKTTLFKSYVESPEIVLIPGVGDALSARLVEKAGFKAVFLSGYAASASLLGAPDVGLLSMTEMADCARRIADAVELPLFADGDNGHGNATNVMRTMREFEKAGVAAIFFEDQVSPSAAVTCRATSDSGGGDDGQDPCRRRCASGRGSPDHGADRRAFHPRHRRRAWKGCIAIWKRARICPLWNRRDRSRRCSRITQEIAAPNMANMVAGGKTPLLSANELEGLGFSIAAYPVLTTYAMAHAIQRVLEHLQSRRTIAGFDDTLDFAAFNRLIGLEELRAKESLLYGSF